MTDPSTREELLKEAKEASDLLFDVDQKIYQNSIPTTPGPTTAWKHADLFRRLAAALEAAPPPGEGWRREHRFGAPPEPMSRPDEDWCDEYDAVFNHDHQI